MIMNNKKQLFGVVENVEENNDYKGLTTDTATVTVDNKNRTISVDANVRYNLGEIPGTAYPGNMGAETRKLAVATLEAHKKEEARSKEADKQLSIKLSNIKNIVDDINSDYASKVSISVADAVDLNIDKVLIDGQLQGPKDSIIYLVKDGNSEGYKQYTLIDKELTLIGTTDIDLSKYATLSYVDLSISNIDFTPYAKVEDIPDVSNFITEIPEEYITDTELDERDYLTSENLTDYATKVYVQSEISKIETVKKIVVDSVDIESGTVVIDGVTEQAADGIIYLVKSNDSAGYLQYMLLEAQLTLIGTTDVDLSQYATINYVDSKIEEIPQPDLSDYAKKEDIPDVSSFIAEIPEEYITETELRGQLDPLQQAVETSSELLTNFINQFNSIELIDGGTSDQFK